MDPASGDPERISTWMAQPHLSETWEQPWPVEKWRADSQARLDSGYSRPLIFSIDGVEVGYAEVYRAAQDEVACVYEAEPADLGIHIATGDLAFVGRGRASGFLGALTAALLEADPAVHRVIADPDVRNARMHAALRKHGYTHRGDVDVRPGRRIALYIVERP